LLFFGFANCWFLFCMCKHCSKYFGCRCRPSIYVLIFSLLSLVSSNVKSFLYKLIISFIYYFVYSIDHCIGKNIFLQLIIFWNNSFLKAKNFMRFNFMHEKPFYSYFDFHLFFTDSSHRPMSEGHLFEIVWHFSLNSGFYFGF
jgi:hypothetical protein